MAWWHKYFPKSSISTRKVEPVKKKTMLDLSKIIKVDFPESQYYKQEYPKKQLILHHTASGRGTNGDFTYWLNTPSRIATCVIVGYKGVVHQCFGSKWWGHHIGVKQAFLKSRAIDNYKIQNLYLNKHSIAIEIDAWGGLTKENGVWKTYTGKTIDSGRVVEFPEGYRGYYAFERYTDEQIKSVEELCVFWNERYDIPLDYNVDMWEVSNNALNGHAGIYCHNSFRDDKSDICPQPEIVQMIKGLAARKEENDDEEEEEND